MTTFEVAGRNKKAAAILAVLRKAGVTADDARGGSANDWALAATAANVNPPSDATIALVLQMLETGRTQ